MWKDEPIRFGLGRSSRVALSTIACLFITLGFVGAESQPFNVKVLLSQTPIPPYSFSSPQNQMPTLARTKTPTLTSTAVLFPRVPAGRSSYAPLFMQGQPQVDANTIALYHFDTPAGSQSIDATGNYTGTLYGNASIATTGLYGGALQLDGSGSYVRTGNVGSLDSGTIESFVDFAEGCYTASEDFTIFSAGGEFGSNQQPVLWLGSEGYLRFYFYANNKLYLADSTINPCRYLAGGNVSPNFYPYGLSAEWPYETWRFHHVAGTWGPRGIEIWVDGVLHGVGQYVPDPTNLPPHNGYSCSPQQQELSPVYPNCNVPQIGLVPGSYGGGLPSYSTFLIGCGSNPNPMDPTPNCFKGRIDEVRISNIQRTFTVAVDPTITPTPTQTPVGIVGAYSVDAQTLALYHLESIGPAPSRVVNDEAGMNNAQWEGNTSLVSQGRFGNAFYLDGNGSFFHTANAGNPMNGSVEAWVNLAGPGGQYGIVSAGYEAYQMGDKINLGVDWGSSTLRFGINDGNQWFWADSGVAPSYLFGCWHHVAGTWGGRGLEIWVDGVLRGSIAFYGGMPGGASTYPYLFGCDGFGRCMKGKIDEVRVSNVQRTFTPNSPSFRPSFSTKPNSTVSRGSTPSTGRSPSASGTLTFLPFVEVNPTPTPPPCTYGS